MKLLCKKYRIKKIMINHKMTNFYYYKNYNKNRKWLIMVIYVDVVIMENFIINAFLMLLSMQICRVKIKYIRLCMVSFLLSMYTIVMIIPSLSSLTILPIKLLVCFIGIILYLGKREFTLYIKTWIVFILTSFLFAGICFYISVDENGYSLLSNFTIGNVSAKYILICGAALYIVLTRIVTYIKDNIAVDKFIYDLTVIINGNSYDIKGFLDTGNELIEPISMLPVIIVEKSSIPCIDTDEDCYYINYSTVDSENNVMKGVIPQKLLIKIKDKYIEKDAVICTVDRKLSNDGQYNALIARGLI